MSLFLKFIENQIQENTNYEVMADTGIFEISIDEVDKEEDNVLRVSCSQGLFKITIEEL